MTESACDEVARARIEAHEDQCVIQYKNLRHEITEIKGLLRWGGGLAFVTIIGLLGWSLKAQYDTNTRALNDSAARIAVLEQQLSNRR